MHSAASAIKVQTLICFCFHFEVTAGKSHLTPKDSACPCVEQMHAAMQGDGPPPYRLSDCKVSCKPAQLCLGLPPTLKNRAEDRVGDLLRPLRGHLPTQQEVVATESPKMSSAPALLVCHSPAKRKSNANAKQLLELPHLNTNPQCSSLKGDRGKRLTAPSTGHYQHTEDFM